MTPEDNGPSAFFKAMTSAFRETIAARRNYVDLVGALCAQAFDSFERNVEIQAEGAPALACKGECAACCTLQVAVTAPEAFLLARFIGASNVITGIARDNHHVAFADATLQVVGATLDPGQKAIVAIRQHDIQLSTRAPPNPDNTVKATVTRQVFLGASRDYMVETPDGTSLRVVTPTDNAVPAGTAVWLYLPPERCRALSR